MPLDRKNGSTRCAMKKQKVTKAQVIRRIYDERRRTGRIRIKTTRN
ncbi:hypothetical protein [Vibrio gallaecicus]|nr:hypothetical protein [Vibrio gallaecicus]MDN3615606.1 hypothetical protein [Vibrio gallaecicus]